MNKQKTQPSRTNVIVKTSVLGIVTNVFLSAFKAVVGFLSSSIAIVLDAVNNLSDGLSSIITIIGTKLAGKKPNKKHPYGHGRIEYITAMIIAAIILYAGITSMVESIKKIITPETPDYSTISLVIVSVAVVIKILIGLYFKKVGKKVNSDSLVGSGNDAIMDSVISAATLVSAIIFIASGVSLEAYLGIIIAIFIIRTAIMMLKNALSQILGERVSPQISTAVKQTIAKVDGVYGIYDLILNNYGPDRYMGSVHVEIPDTFTAKEIDKLTRIIIKDVYVKHGVILNAVGIYSINTQDKEAIAIHKQITKMVLAHSTVLQMHGFYISREDKTITFDIILDFEDKNKEETYKAIHAEVSQKFPEYKIYITLDEDISD